MPRMDIAALRAAAPPGVRWSRASSPTPTSRRCSARADLVVLPYREIDQSGVLFTALAFGSPLLLSDVGRLPRDRGDRSGRARPAGRRRHAARRAGTAAERPGGPRPARGGGPGGSGWPVRVGRNRRGAPRALRPPTLTRNSRGQSSFCHTAGCCMTTRSTVALVTRENPACRCAPQPRSCSGSQPGCSSMRSSDTRCCSPPSRGFGAAVRCRSHPRPTPTCPASR